MWLKFQRDMAERGHSLESIKASIEARKPDFDAYIGKILLLKKKKTYKLINNVIDITSRT